MSDKIIGYQVGPYWFASGAGGINALCGQRYKREDDLLRDSKELGCGPVVRVHESGREDVIYDPHNTHGNQVNS